MNNLNSVLIEGNLTKDPDVNRTNNGTFVSTFAVACNRYYKVDDEPKEEVSFIDIETWGRLAETCYEYLKKGRGVRVVGRLKQHRWETDGKFRSKIVIVAEHVEFKPDYKSNARKSEEAESAYV
jgi:single-strand DNA-binding protein